MLPDIPKYVKRGKPVYAVCNGLTEYMNVSMKSFDEVPMPSARTSTDSTDMAAH